MQDSCPTTLWAKIVWFLVLRPFLLTIGYSNIVKDRQCSYYERLDQPPTSPGKTVSKIHRCAWDCCICNIMDLKYPKHASSKSRHRRKSSANDSQSSHHGQERIKKNKCKINKNKCPMD
ncbi:hypothetical protein BO71DRAFT_402487 [Aspergillus ellipticus CBS 707.79]|uniref:Uncharacterized protein n=1 Tax=Aspergillus ellipticus CBS 707.79 TaxID=1448320 RepID=A0A319EGS0_9EURO|nr:hypothetical protein BO71DRAFT_402487 [Aspergillus ellipticus CBS 707.79]